MESALHAQETAPSVQMPIHAILAPKVSFSLEQPATPPAHPTTTPSMVPALPAQVTALPVSQPPLAQTATLVTHSGKEAAYKIAHKVHSSSVVLAINAMPPAKPAPISRPAPHVQKARISRTVFALVIAEIISTPTVVPAKLAQKTVQLVLTLKSAQAVMMVTV